MADNNAVKFILFILGNLYCFVKAFVAERTFSVSVAETIGERQSSATGVPQGLVISAAFIVAMPDLSKNLEPIEGVKDALYADALTLCTNSGSHGEQETALQAGLHVMYDYMRICGMESSP